MLTIHLHIAASLADGSIKASTYTSDEPFSWLAFTIFSLSIFLIWNVIDPPILDSGS